MGNVTAQEIEPILNESKEGDVEGHDLTYVTTEEGPRRSKRGRKPTWKLRELNLEGDAY